MICAIQQIRLRWHRVSPELEQRTAADTAAAAVKPNLPAKDEVRALLDRLPDAVTLEDIHYHLDVYINQGAGG